MDRQPETEEVGDGDGSAILVRHSPYFDLPTASGSASKTCSMLGGRHGPRPRHHLHLVGAVASPKQAT